MTIGLRPAAGATDLGTIAAIINATSPENSTSVEDMAWSDATYPGTERFIVELDGRPVGAATVGRIFMYPPDYDALWATVDVLPAARRRGIGSHLLATIAGTAARAGKAALHVPGSAARPDGVTFLEHRGFVVFERAHAVRLDLVDRRAGSTLAGRAPDVPDGVELTDLAARPELVEGVRAVAMEAFLDIPGGDTPMAPGGLAEFRARDVDRPGIPHDGFFVAIERATGRVVGYASLVAKPGSPGVAFHDMTAVARSWRGRGIATCLKLRTIAWAVDHGLDALETGNDQANEAMRAVNGRLGYRPMPDLLILRGSVGAAMMRP